LAFPQCSMALFQRFRLLYPCFACYLKNVDNAHFTAHALVHPTTDR
jgi:hypothetical protein